MGIGFHRWLDYFNGIFECNIFRQEKEAEIGLGQASRAIEQCDINRGLSQVKLETSEGRG